MSNSYFSKVVNKMVESLEYEARDRGLSLEGITLNNFNCFLDDLFQDGGETRCEQFTDLAWEYAEDFGEFGSDEWEEARWEVTEAALNILEQKYS